MGEERFPRKILIVDHDQSVVNQVASMLANHKIPVVKAISYDQALYHFNNNKIELCIIEKELENIHGAVLVQKFRNHDITSKRNPGFIITSNSKADQDQSIFKELGGICVLQKPIKEPTLISMIVRAMEEAHQRSALHELKINVIDPLLRSGQHEQAVAIAESKLMQSGKKARFLASEINEDAEKYQRALDITSDLHSGDPKNLRYVNQLGRLNMKMGKLDTAQKFYETADKLAPDNIRRTQEMATMYLKLRLPEKSIEKYKALIKNNPEEPELKYTFFEELQREGFAREAKDFCNETTGTMELIRHFNNRGVLYSKKEQYLDAIDEYTKAKRLIPDSKELYRILYNIAIAHINLKTPFHLQKASDILEKILKLKPDFEKAKIKLEMINRHIDRSAS